MLLAGAVLVVLGVTGKLRLQRRLWHEGRTDNTDHFMSVPPILFIFISE